MTTFRINGCPIPVDVEGDTPLSWVICYFVGLTGTKFGCGMVCAGPAPSMAGPTTRSCITPVAQ